MDSFKRFFRCPGAFVELCVLILLLNSHVSYSQDDPRYEIVIKVKQEALKLPDRVSTTNIISASSFENLSPELEKAFIKYKVKSITKIYPDFKQSDRIRTTRTGRTVTLRDKSLEYIIKLENIDDVERAIASINTITGIY